MPTYYEILGVEPGANSEEIKMAYDKQAIANHPTQLSRLQGSDPRLTREILNKRMEDLNKAYEILLNPYKRAMYEKSLPEAQRVELEAQKAHKKIFSFNYYSFLKISPLEPKNQKLFDDQISNIHNELRKQPNVSALSYEKRQKLMQNFNILANMRAYFHTEEQIEIFDKSFARYCSLDKPGTIKTIADAMLVAKTMEGGFEKNIKKVCEHPNAQQAFSNLEDPFQKKLFLQHVASHLSIEQIKKHIEDYPVTEINEIYAYLPYLKKEQLYVFFESIGLLHDKKNFKDFKDGFKSGAYKQHTDGKPINSGTIKTLNDWSKIHENKNYSKLGALTGGLFTNNQQDNIQVSKEDELLVNYYSFLEISPLETNTEIFRKQIADFPQKNYYQRFKMEAISQNTYILNCAKFMRVEHILFHEEQVRKKYDKLYAQYCRLDNPGSIETVADVMFVAKTMRGGFEYNIKKVCEHPNAQQAFSNLEDPFQKKLFLQHVASHLSIEQIKKHIEDYPVTEINEIYAYLPYLKKEQLFAFFESIEILHDKKNFKDFKDGFASGAYKQHTDGKRINSDIIKILNDWFKIHHSADQSKLDAVTRNSYSNDLKDNIRVFNDWKTKFQDTKENKIYTKNEIIEALKAYQDIRVKEYFTNNNHLEWARDNLNTTGSAKNKLSIVEELIKNYGDDKNTKSFKELVGENKSAKDGRLGKLIDSIIKSEERANQNKNMDSKTNEEEPEVTYKGPQ